MTTKPSQENPFLNLFVNIFLPVIVLNKGGKYLDPRWTLVLALSFPLVYAIQDYVRHGNKNYVSMLGIVNTMLTGGLALMHLEGIWFSLKEALLPLVLASYWSKNPAAKMMFCNPQILNMEFVEIKLHQQNKTTEFTQLLRSTTLWFALSFLISAVLNFVIAQQIFVPIDPALEQTAKDNLLNEQIAKMTWMGFVAIAFPLMFYSLSVFAADRRNDRRSHRSNHAKVVTRS
jgi:hypothetical protein